jgi:hypothetical protein
VTKRKIVWGNAVIFKCPDKGRLLEAKDISYLKMLPRNLSQVHGWVEAKRWELHQPASRNRPLTSKKNEDSITDYCRTF